MNKKQECELCFRPTPGALQKPPHVHISIPTGWQWEEHGELWLREAGRGMYASEDQKKTEDMFESMVQMVEKLEKDLETLGSQMKKLIVLLRRKEQVDPDLR